jgi:hypothetical protein
MQHCHNKITNISQADRKGKLDHDQHEEDITSNLFVFKVLRNVSATALKNVQN